MRSPLLELYKARIREFYRAPARLFWVYGFPLILAIVLGTAFTAKKPAPITVDVVDGPGADAVRSALDTPEATDGSGARPGVRFVAHPREQALRRWKTGEAILVVEPNPAGPPTYHYDATRPEAAAARLVVDDALQAAWGRPTVGPDGSAVSSRADDDTEPVLGSRYIDFLVPGLIGLNTMGGGLWGVGFLIVSYRTGKLLKRFLATPMPRRDFLMAILMGRLTFLLPDVGLLLLVGHFGFGVPIRGSLFVFGVVAVVGALAFAGIGLLVASRARAIETVSALMNLVMMPMWLASGVFFSTSNFPKEVQPLIRALPLTQLVEANRMVLLQGAGFAEVWTHILILAAWSVVTFVLALKLFRWT